MKIALIGSTGFVGGSLLQEFVSRGHSVTAIARSAGTIAPHDAINPVSVDVRETVELTEVLQDHDAVVSAYNPGWDNPNIYEEYLAGSKSIIAAVKGANVPRLLVIGGAGSLFVDGQQLVDSPDFPAFIKPGASAARDFLEHLGSETELDWVFLSPPIEFGPDGPEERRGTYRKGSDSPVFDSEGHSIISPADLAIAVCDELEQPVHHRERFTVGY